MKPPLKRRRPLVRLQSSPETWTPQALRDTNLAREAYNRRRPIKLSWHYERGLSTAFLSIAGSLFAMDQVGHFAPIAVRVLRGEGDDQGKLALEFREWRPSLRRGDHAAEGWYKCYRIMGDRYLCFRATTLCAMVERARITVVPHGKYLVGDIPKGDGYVGPPPPWRHPGLPLLRGVHYLDPEEYISRGGVYSGKRYTKIARKLGLDNPGLDEKVGEQPEGEDGVSVADVAPDAV